MVTLHQFRRAWHIPNPSQFCVKLETYLRMAEIEYRIVETLPLAAPLGKLPYIEHDGRKIADSRIIIGYLQQRFSDGPDQTLTARQKPKPWLGNACWKSICTGFACIAAGRPGRRIGASTSKRFFRAYRRCWPIVSPAFTDCASKARFAATASAACRPHRHSSWAGRT